MSKRETAPMMVVRTKDGFEPLTRYDWDQAEAFPLLSRLEASFRLRRYLPRHRLYWAILTAVIDNVDLWTTTEDLHWALKMRLGYVEDGLLIGGELHLRPRSIAFDKMDEAEFKKFLDAALLVITTEILPGTNIEDLVRAGRDRTGGDG